MSYNHRVSISTTPTQSIEYLYNAQNQRVAKKVNGQIVEKYLWSNLTTLLAIYDKDDNLIQRFEYSDGRMPTSMTQNNTKYYLHYDQVGSLRAVSDTSGNIIKEITYDTYGNILSDTNANFKVPFGFAGGLYDSDTKLTRFGYRDYDSYTGKWTAKDPIDFAGGDTNLYGYVLGDPVNFVDVEGKKKSSLSPAACAILATLKTNPSIDKCRTMVWDAYYDQMNGNQDYSIMCKVGNPGACSIGCVTNDFWNNLIDECAGDAMDLKDAHGNARKKK